MVDVCPGKDSLLQLGKIPWYSLDGDGAIEYVKTRMRTPPVRLSACHPGAGGLSISQHIGGDQ